ncbi:hypothetical protein [Alsobacter sp. SYSU BS001988]
MTIPVPSHHAPAFAAISAGALVALSCVGLAFSGPDISVGHKVAPAMGGRAVPDDAGALVETAPAGRDVRVVLASPFGPAPPGAAKPGFRPAVEAKASPELASLPAAAAAQTELGPATPEDAAGPPPSILAPTPAPAAAAAVAAVSGGVRKVGKSRTVERRTRRARVAQVRRPGFRPPPFLAFLFR